MKSGNPDVYRPHGGRTEREVAAEVIVRLLEVGELHRTPAASPAPAPRSAYPS
jgi:hypothetical protein